MRKFLFILLGTILFNSSKAQVFTSTLAGNSGAIPDNGTIPTCFTQTVTSVGNINTKTYGLNSVTINVTHGWVSDLVIKLTAPDGTLIMLSNQNGGSGANYTNTVFNATAVIPIANGKAPFTGSFLPDEGIGTVNNGQNADGIWSLCVQDMATSFKGNVKSWSLNFNNKPAPPPPPPPVKPTCTSSGLATDLCIDAPMVCNFSGFCGNTSASFASDDNWSELVAAASCIGTIDNSSFIKFTAGATAATFNVWVTTSQTGLGIQTFFFEANQCQGTSVISHGCKSPINPLTTPTSLPTLISATGLTVGNVYYLMFDGVAGDVCDFVVSPISGVSIFKTTSIPSTFNVCKGAQVELTATSSDLNATFTWSLESPKNIVPDGLSTHTSQNNDTVIVNTSVMPLNTQLVYLCSSSQNLGFCPTDLRDTIRVVDSAVIKTVPLPAAQIHYVGYPLDTLKVICAIPGVTYQWYSSKDSVNYGGTLIIGATSPNYVPSNINAGKLFYYCLVDNAGCAASSSTVASVTLTIPPVCNNPDSIFFLQQPTSVAQGIPMSPSVTVREICSSTGVYATTPGNVTLTASDGGCGFVSQTKPFVNGIATFNNIVFTRSLQNGISLTASSTGFQNIVSNKFNVTAPPSTPFLDTLKYETFSTGILKSWSYKIDTGFVNGETNKKQDFSQIVTVGANSYFDKSYKASSGPTGKGTIDTITFSNLSGLSNMTQMKLSFKVASLNRDGTSITPVNGGGTDAGEDLIVQTSVDSGVTWKPLLTHQGGADKLFPFANTITTLTYGTNRNLTSTSSSSAFVTTIPNGTSKFQFRVIASNNRVNENWCIDDIAFIGLRNRNGLPDSLPTVVAKNDTSICSGTTATLYAIINNGKAPISYAWSPVSGFSLPTDTALASPITVPLSSTQTYSLNISDKDNCKANSNIVTVTVTTLPITYSLQAPTDTVCINGKLDTLKTNAVNAHSYQWYENATPTTIGSTLITGATLSYYLPPSTTVGIKYYYCVLKSNCAATVTTSVSGAIVVNSVPTITISGNNSICSGSSTTLTGSGGDSYVWTSGPSTTTYSVSPTANTNYEVTGTTTATGCSNKATISVTVFAPIAAPSITVVQPTCTVATGSVSITSSTTGLQFSIDGGATYIGTTTFNNLPAGPFSVIAKDANGCVSIPTTGSIIAPAGALSVKLITSKADSCIGTTLYLTGASTASNIVWYQNGTSISNINSVPPTKGVTVATIGGYTAFGYMGVAVDSKGNVYTSDFINNVVTKWAPGASVRDTAAGGNGQGFALNQLYSPSGLFIDDNDTLYIADRNNSRVIKFPPNSTASTLGTIVAGGGGNGSTPDKLKDPTGVYVDNSGNVYVADASNNRIQKWSRKATSGVTVAGGNTAGSNSNQFNTPSSVSFDKSGNMYVSDILNNRIQKFTPPFSSSSIGQTLPISGLGFPSGIFIDKNDSLFIADRNRQRILKYSIAKSTVSLVCGVPLVLGNSADKFENPLSVWVREGAIYVADYFNSRVQKWAPSIDTFYTPTVSTSYYAEATNTSGCTTTSNTITVNSPVTPSITITPSVTGTICKGTPVTFTAAITSGGNSPSYQWQLNGANITSATGATYTLISPNDKDSISCILTSSYTCLVSPNAISNGIKLIVKTIPVVSAISGTLTVCPLFTTQLSNTFLGGKWISSDTFVAKVDSITGLVKGVASGSATITYTVTNTCGTDSKSVTITVSGSAPVVPSITGSNAALCPADTKQLANSLASGTWSSDATSIATVNGSGLVTAIAEGTANISYSITNSCGTSTQTFPITVNPAKPVVASITGTATVCPTSTTQLANTTTGGTWSSNATSIATIAGGLVSGIATGNATITYTVTSSCGTDSKSILVTVNPAAPVVPAITGSSAAMCPNDTKQITNTLTGGTWTSDNNASATVTTTGLVTAIAQGTATISYTVTNSCGTDSKTFAITVNAAAPVVDVITGTTTICPATTTQLADVTAGGTWTSNLPAVATVDGTGLVSGIATGTATITYSVTNSCGTDSKTIVITVSPAAPFVPAITGSAAAMCPNGTKQLANTLAGGTWTSDNIASATVTTTGLVTATAQGTATITYTVTNTCGTDSKTFAITVNAAPPIVDVITGTSTICPNTTTQLVDATTGGTWVSNNTTIAIVGPTSGLVTGVKSGSATVTYTVTNSCGSDSKSIVITISPAAPVVPVITGSSAAMCPNGTKQLSNTLIGGTWTSDNNASAIVSTSGLVTAIAQGTATITYTVTNSCGTDSKTFGITVNAAPPIVDVITGTSTICPNTTTQLADVTAGGTWTSNLLAVASVGPTTGLVTGVKSGTATITYKVTNSCGSDSKSIVITVSPAAPVVPAITGSATAMCPNGTKQLYNSLAGGTWTSDNNTSATVSTNGLVTAISQGTATITYTVTNSCGTDSKTFGITVNTAPPVVDVITGNTTICPGATTQLADITLGGTWTCNPSTVATVIPNTGLVTGIKSGTATITYKVTNSCGSDSKSIVITVSSAAPVVPAITGNTTICPTKTTTLRNTLTGGTWTSSDINIATVGSNNGFVTGIAQGTATITYSVTNSCGSDSRSITVIVSPPAPTVPTITGITTICPSTTTQLSNALSGGVWTSSNAAILQVNNSTGLVTGTTSGTATVTYTVTNSCGSNANSIVVTVDPAAPKVPAITGSNKVCPNKTISLNNALAGGVWSSSDLTVATVSSSGVVSGVAQGNAIITYTVTNSCGVDSKQIAITVNAPIPVVPAITGSSSLCPNTTAQLTNALSGGVWKSSNSGIASVVSSTGLVTALSSGLTTISYIVTNSCGADTSTLPLTVIKPIQTYVHIKADTTTICSGGTVTFIVDSTNGGGSPQYQWTKNNLFIAGATTDTYVANGLNNGDVINCLFTSSLACVTGTNVFSNNIKITVKPNLIPSISIKTNSGQSSVDTTCKGSPLGFTATVLNGGTNPLFQWKVNGFDTLGNASNANLVLTTLSDNDKVSCVLKSSEGCLASNYPMSNLIKVVVIDKPAITNIVTTGSIVCYNGVLQLSNLTPNGTWSSSATNYATVSNTGLVKGVAAGNTTINYVVGNSGRKCFYSTASINIAVEGLPLIAPINASASSICKGDSILLTNNISKGYWKSSDTNIAKADSVKGWVLGKKPGNDTIKYIIKGYCGISEVIKPIYVSGKTPVSKKAEIITKPTCLYPLTGNVKVSVNGYSNESPYQFTFNNNTYTAPNTISNLGVNLYPIMIYNNIGCIVDSIPNFVLPYSSNANCDTMYVPSGFIPSSNSGNKNHTLKPFGGGYLQSVSFKVFNRLGNLVFESHDINSGWDGTMNGKLQDAGTYIWFLEYKQANGVVRQNKGVSVLIK